MRKRANTPKAQSQQGLPTPLVIFLLSLPLLACAIYYFGNDQINQLLSTPTSTPILTYFAAKGRAEPIRLLLKDANVKFIQRDLGKTVEGDKTVTFADLKASGVLDYGQVPFWEEDGLQLVQSAAIMRHLARRYGYNGNNELEATKIDAVSEGCKDFTLAMSSVFRAPEDQKASVWNTTVTQDIPKWLGHFEKLLAKSSTGFFVGNKLSYGDIYVAVLTEEVRAANLGLENYPLLSAHLTSFLSRPRIASYVADPSRFPYSFARYKQ